jgi:threonine synthase
MKTPQTPVHKLAVVLGIKSEVWLKREDKHKYGSHKGRSLPLMISTYHKENEINSFVISSSGNGALAAGLTIKAHNRNKPNDLIKLNIYVGEKIPSDKLNSLKKELNDSNIIIEQLPNPKQGAFLMDKEGKAKLLRQSNDALALLGYNDLAAELAKIENLEAVFIPTSSGTTAEGLYTGFQLLGLNPEIHIIQTDVCHPMVELPQSPHSNDKQALVQKDPSVVLASPALTQDDTGSSLANAIVDKVAYRKDTLLEVLKKSGGAGWIATNEEIKAAVQLVKDITSLTISANSALSVVGLKKAVENGKKWNGPVVCLITGK